jgi:hypothetical protein
MCFCLDSIIKGYLPTLSKGISQVCDSMQVSSAQSQNIIRPERREIGEFDKT